ncbi:MAG TPA: cytochrome P450 [Trueperaceae bacterium]
MIETDQDRGAAVGAKQAGAPQLGAQQVGTRQLGAQQADSNQVGASDAAGCPYHGMAMRRSQPPEVGKRGARTKTGPPRREVASMSASRQVLKAAGIAKQDGFGIREAASSPLRIKPPVLWQDGAEHKAQRTAIAHFFTPMAAKQRYRPVIENVADELVGELESSGRAELTNMAMKLAVAVASQVVGLTDSTKPGMHERIDAFIALGPSRPSWRPREMLRFLRLQKGIADYFRFDVRPAIAARRAEPRDDVISHLLAQGAGEQDVLIEAITYGAAGMVTTREFIAMAAWHLLDDDGLRSRYLAGDERARQGILSEIIRLEPVVGRLFRRLDGELELEDEKLDAGTRVTIDVRAANGDDRAVGPHPLCLDPERVMSVKGVQGYGLSFGDGPHRCPGSFLALEEADVFLSRVLSLPGIRLEKPPRLTFNDLIQGYELRDMWVAASER